MGISFDLGAGDTAPEVSAGSTVNAASGWRGGANVSGCGPPAGDAAEWSAGAIACGLSMKGESGGAVGSDASHGNAGSLDETADLGGGSGDAGTEGGSAERSGARMGRVFPVRGRASANGEGLTGGGITGLGGCAGAAGEAGVAESTPGDGGRDIPFIRSEMGMDSVTPKGGGGEAGRPASAGVTGRAAAGIGPGGATGGGGADSGVGHADGCWDDAFVMPATGRGGVPSNGGAAAGVGAATCERGGRPC